MRKSRKSAIIKRVVARSISNTGVNKFVPTFGGGLNNTAELSLMAREEWEQRLVDDFWGLDKDLKDRNQEIALMIEEDYHSRRYEQYLRTQHIHAMWDNEFLREQEHKKYLQRQHTATIRTDHLRLINSPIAVEDIIKVLWANSSSEQQTLTLQEKIPPSLKDTVRIGLNGTQGSGSYSLEGGGGGGGGGSVTAASLDSVHMSLHLEGLQRSREILDNAKMSYRKVVKELKNLDLVPPATAPSTRGSTAGLTGSPSQLNYNQPSSSPQLDTLGGGVGGGSSVGKVNHAGSVFSNDDTKQSQSRSIFSAIQEVSNALGLPASPNEIVPLPVYNDALEGHPIYKWDQEIMIQTAFNLLDRGNKGYLTREDLTAIANDLNIHNLLQYTVFWSVIKRREWFVFEQLLYSSATTDHNHHSNHHNSSLTGGTNSLTTSASAGSGQGRNHPLYQNNSNNNNVTIAPLIRQKSTSSIRSSHSAQGGGASGGGSAKGDHLLPPRSGGGSGNTLYNPSIYKFQQHPKESISYFQLLDCALSLSKHMHAHIQSIRTQEEHEHYTSLLTKPRHQQFPSSYYDNENNGVIRHFRVMRKLTVGDCVWALHRNGVRWLPAVIMKIHYPKTVIGGGISRVGSPQREDSLMSAIKEENDEAVPQSSPDGKKKNPTITYTNREENYFYYYDLWFPLNEKELMKSRMMTISRQLLTLPSQASLASLQQQ